MIMDLLRFPNIFGRSLFLSYDNLSQLVTERVYKILGASIIFTPSLVLAKKKNSTFTYFDILPLKSPLYFQYRVRFFSYL